MSSHLHDCGDHFYPSSVHVVHAVPCLFYHPYHTLLGKGHDPKKTNRVRDPSLLLSHLDHDRKSKYLCRLWLCPFLFLAHRHREERNHLDHGLK